MNGRDSKNPLRKWIFLYADSSTPGKETQVKPEEEKQVHDIQRAAIRTSLFYSEGDRVKKEKENEGIILANRMIGFWSYIFYISILILPLTMIAMVWRIPFATEFGLTSVIMLLFSQVQNALLRGGIKIMKKKKDD